MRNLLLLLCVFSAGCGGGGGGGNSAPSPFAGSFSGPWASTDQNGTATITIASSGNAAGTVTNVQLGLTGSVTGHINANGNINVTVIYQGFQPLAGSGVLALTNGNNTLSGAVTFNGEASNFTLSRQ